jgi:hypothetical protein
MDKSNVKPISVSPAAIQALFADKDFKRIISLPEEFQLSALKQIAGEYEDLGINVPEWFFPAMGCRLDKDIVSYFAQDFAVAWELANVDKRSE